MSTILRVIDLVTNLVTRETLVDMKHHNGEIKSDLERDILKVAMITGGTEGLRIFVGLIKGFGLQTGAIATTSAWDVCGLVVVGVNEADMAAAANRVFALHGGTVLYADAHVQAELAQPIAGLMSEEPLETVVQRLEDVQKKMTDLGCPLPDPLLTLCVLTTPAIPFLRISEEGLVDIKEGKIVGLF